MTKLFESLETYLERTKAQREELYRWFHQHPELSLQEAETKARIIKELEALDDVEVVDVGAGFVGILRNGDGHTVAMRADFDGLPVKEDSGVEYASTATQVSDKAGQEVPVGHMCGHDMHTTWLLTTISFLAENRNAWSGTFEAVFQPAEEIAEGGKNMVAAGITGKVPVPDVMLGQHVMGALSMGHVATNEGISFTQASTVKVTVRGVGSHGSMPEKSVDPIVLSSSIIMQLQTIISRELPASERAVVSVGTIHGGTKANVIPDKVVFELNTRCYSQEVEDHIHASIERIVSNQAAAAGAPEPSFEYSERFPVLDNDRDVTAKVTESMQTLLGEERTETFAPLSASEDFPDIPNAFGTPYCFWVVGGFPDPENAPGNHSPQFVPELHPTLEAGAEATVAALCPWLAV
ncbi:TPA: amidohydrolase [Corynebacterium striatum]|uniref:amidohydrolase n=1 Tax=Corynebacterium striatum TaxID=43770 RepID=UPI000D773750|nr:amidohydrolase [Corynebacterium striatum]PXY04052.1 amidohydrolase [Corynebacterium striatum]HAT1144664.1 amidohydrolase [Corynebacterium striatum]HAT1168226.1 amidohydrolase [Corynebacterium striatum]HAT1173243.1 amidohydrolase [Corynebacterium striatum]HAT1198516.1 amidohydrolase [Corynebacterium striatum]